MKPIRVLLIEDDELDSEAMCRRLSRSREQLFDVDRASTLREGIDLAGATGHDAALLDLSLPDATGLETLRRMRGALPDLPIIILTGFEDAELSTLALREGAQDYLVKGDLAAVERAIRYAIERGRSERERRAIEERLSEAQRLESLGLLAGGVAHDFNNILTTILGHASLCLIDSAPDTPAAVGLRRIEEAAKRAGELCGQLLAYSGRGRLVVGPVRLSGLVGGMIEMLRVSLPSGVRIHYDLVEDVPDVEANEAQLRQLLMNLVLNAADAIGDECGTITVRTREEGSDAGRRQVVLEVTDDGCGMDDETATQIFDPFFSTKGTGRGLGLAAAQGTVRKHGGWIEVESEPGVGTTMRVSLPPAAADVDDVVAPLPAARKADGAVTAVLVVEDDADIGDLAKSTLEAAGFEVELVKDGDRALDLLAEHRDRFSVVFLDLKQADADGAATQTAIERRYPDLPLILTSGWSAPDARARLGSGTVAAFLPKPFTGNELVDACSRAIGDLDAVRG